MTPAHPTGTGPGASGRPRGEPGAPGAEPIDGSAAQPGRDAPGADAAAWEQVQDSPDFARLRHALRSFVFPTTVAFLLWYLAYVVCAAYARGFMATKVFGTVNVGLLFGLLQFVSTFGIAVAYSRYADRRMDPLADGLRARIEGIDR